MPSQVFQILKNYRKFSRQSSSIMDKICANWIKWATYVRTHIIWLHVCAFDSWDAQMLDIGWWVSVCYWLNWYEIEWNRLWLDLLDSTQLVDDRLHYRYLVIAVVTAVATALDVHYSSAKSSEFLVVGRSIDRSSTYLPFCTLNYYFHLSFRQTFFISYAVFLEKCRTFSLEGWWWSSWFRFRAGTLNRLSSAT